MSWKSALTALLATSGTGLYASAQCNPKPIPARDIKFSDIGAGDIYNFELHGNARIVEPAPLDIPRALRIDQLFSYALLKEIDISPSKMKDATMAIGVFVENIRPAIQNAPNPKQNEAYGWVMSHDNGGYDRAIFLHDERFGGVGMSAGYIPESAPVYIPLQEWVQVVAVWRQGGECSLFIQNEKVDFTEAVIGKNNDGLPSVAIGAPQLRRFGKENDNDFWIKDVKIFDYALSDQEVEDLNCNFVETLEPTLDCGQGGTPVFSCTECVAGDGSASGCSGDCMWRPEIPHCVEKGDTTDNDGPTVNCGDHDASDCSQCDVSGGSSGCSGDCKFDDASGTCVDEDYSPPTPAPSGGGDGCEVISVGLSANGGVASQSSNYHDGGAASLANDGLVSGNYHDRTMSHTSANSRNPWWKVKFDRTPISAVHIMNRQDCCSERIVGFIMEIFDAGKKVYSSEVSASAESSTDKTVYHYEIPQIVGDVVKIRLTNNNPLHMAEVWVMGSSCGASTSTDATPSNNGGTCPVGVNCGGHRVDKCSACPQGNGSAWCNGECMWDGPSSKCVHQSENVNCGGHRADSCSVCPNGNGAAWCNGECMWDGPSSKCVHQTDNVNCGGHRADSCSVCPNGNGAAWCNGECMWDGPSGKCVHQSDNVNCGGHRADSCSVCPNGNGAAWCNGECMWDGPSGKCVHQSDNVNCGGHRADSCSVCPNGNGEVWCNGECDWDSPSCKCVHKTESVNCGGHRADSCYVCPNGNGAAWCNGECTWNFAANSCVKK